MTKLFILLFVSQISIAENLRSRKALEQKRSAKEIVFSLKPGFHFNEQAPNELTTSKGQIKPQELGAKKMKFLMGQNESGEAAVYVCDDAKTYCETHHVPLPGTQSSGKILAHEIPRKTSNSKQMSTISGFIHHDVQKTLKNAKNRKKPVLLVFSARWCPACMRLKDEVLKTEEFFKKTQQLTKIYVDVDLFENQKFSEQFKIKGIPTVVLLDQAQMEVGRFIDFKPLEQVLSFTQSLKILKDDLYAQGRLAFSQDDYVKAIDFFQKMESAPPELIQAQILLAEEKYQQNKEQTGFKDNFRTLLEAAIQNEPITTRSLVWRSKLVPLYKTDSKEQKKTIKEGLNLLSELTKKPELRAEAFKNDESIGEFIGLEDFYLAIIKNEILTSATENPEQKKSSLKELVLYARSLNIPLENKGANTRLLSYIMMSEDYNLALEHVDRLLAKHVDDFDLQRRKANVFLKSKKYPEAIQLAEKLLPQAQGRNQFWVVQTLGQSLLESGQNEKALKVLKPYVERPELNTEKMQPTKTALQELLQKAEKKKE